nr:envelope protein hypervariable domain=env product {V1 and V2 regions} [human immunodeficiency virus type I HIV-1, isolate MA.1190.1, Peptide Partial, 71 aa] [Human immunodeficiency virus 1]
CVSLTCTDYVGNNTGGNSTGEKIEGGEIKNCSFNITTSRRDKMREEYRIFNKLDLVPINDEGNKSFILIHC